MLEKLKSGDNKALETVYRLNYAHLCQVAFKKLGDELLVEELVQDVFLNLWTKRKTLDVNGNLRSYLYATLRNKALHEIRTRMIQSKHYLQIQQQPLTQVPNLEDDYVAKETEYQIKIIIETLPPHCREAFRLSREECLSYSEIAQRMNISVNTVEKHIGKALKILKRDLAAYNTPVITLIGLLALYRL